MSKDSDKYYVSRNKDGTYTVSKFKDGDDIPDRIDIVTRISENLWNSTDPDFMFRRDMQRNKRIRLVKKHIELGEPYGHYTFDKAKNITFCKTDVAQLEVVVMDLSNIDVNEGDVDE